MYQQITLIGRLGSDPTMRFTPNGNAEYMVRRVDRKAITENVAVIRRSFPDDPIIRFCQNVD